MSRVAQAHDEADDVGGEVGGEDVGPAAQFPKGEGSSPTLVGWVIRGRLAPVVDALDDFHAGSPKSSGK